MCSEGPTKKAVLQSTACLSLTASAWPAASLLPRCIRLWAAAMCWVLVLDGRCLGVHADDAAVVHEHGLC